MAEFEAKPSFGVFNFNFQSNISHLYFKRITFFYFRILFNISFIELITKHYFLVTKHVFSININTFSFWEGTHRWVNLYYLSVINIKLTAWNIKFTVSQSNLFLIFRSSTNFWFDTRALLGSTNKRSFCFGSIISQVCILIFFKYAYELTDHLLGHNSVYWSIRLIRFSTVISYL